MQSPQGNIKEGQRLMIIKLRKYNEVVFVTMAAVCMGVKETGM